MTEDLAKSISAKPSGPLKSKPTWKTTLAGCSFMLAFFVSRHGRDGGQTIPMTQPHSMAQQIAQTAIAFEEQRLGRRPKSVTVMLGGDTLVITMHGVLSRGEMLLAESSVGAVTLQEFHQELFNHASEPLKQEITRITGLELCGLAKDRATAAVQVLSNGTVVQVFVLNGRIPATDHWEGT